MADAPTERRVLIDVFAGAGGNSIAFARSGRWDRVYAIEQQATLLECARHNARLYEVEDRITWIHGDCFRVLENELRRVENAVLFASPPWGGECCVVRLVLCVLCCASCVVRLVLCDD